MQTLTLFYVSLSMCGLMLYVLTLTLGSGDVKQFLKRDVVLDEPLEGNCLVINNNISQEKGRFVEYLCRIRSPLKFHNVPGALIPIKGF